MPMKDPMDLHFELQWKKLVQQHGVDTSRPKENFVRSMIHPVIHAMEQHLSNSGLFEIMQDPNFIVNTAPVSVITEAIFYYHLFHTKRLSDHERASLSKSRDYQQRLALEVGHNIVARINDSGIKSATNEMSPEICVSREVCDLMLNLIMDSVRADTHPQEGIFEIFHYAILTAKSSLRLLSAGQSREAFIVWRNLHEQECILLMLTTYGDVAVKAFMEHSKFMRLDFDNSPEKIRNEMDEKSAKKTLENVKNLEKELSNVLATWNITRSAFINYGWLLNINEFSSWFKKQRKSKLSFIDMQQFINFPNYKTVREAYMYANKFTHPTFQTMRLDKQDTYQPCIYSLIPSLQNIVGMFYKYFEEKNIFSDEKSKFYMEQLINVLDDKFKILIANNQKD